LYHEDGRAGSSRMMPIYLFYPIYGGSRFLPNINSHVLGTKFSPTGSVYSVRVTTFLISALKKDAEHPFKASISVYQTL
jgi:hypothetical protein